MNGNYSMFFDGPDDAKSGSPVGYGRPPEQSRFKPGRSGNPRGRPKGSKSNESFAKKHLLASVTIRENGQQRVVTKLEAGLLIMSARYAKADLKVFDIVNQLLARPGAQTIERRHSVDFDELTVEEQYSSCE